RTPHAAPTSPPAPFPPPPLLSFSLLLLRPPPRPPLFPYTTLFRSASSAASSEPAARAFSAAPSRRCTMTAASSRVRSPSTPGARSEEHTSELQSLTNLVCRLLLEKKKTTRRTDLTSHSECVCSSAP